MATPKSILNIIKQAETDLRRPAISRDISKTFDSQLSKELYQKRKDLAAQRIVEIEEALKRSRKPEKKEPVKKEEDLLTTGDIVSGGLGAMLAPLVLNRTNISGTAKLLGIPAATLGSILLYRSLKGKQGKLPLELTLPIDPNKRIGY